MIYYFIWNGVNCRTKGIRLQAMQEIVKPEERVEHVTIPGRAGDLTVLEGDDIYESYIQTVDVVVMGAANVREAEKWLRGDGYITFSSQPTLKQRARVINAVNFKKHSRNSDCWDGQVQFYCQPLKELVTSSDIEVTSSGTTVNNPGDVESRPKIMITGSGDITVRIGERALVLTGVESGWVIDSETEWVLDNGAPLPGVYTGEFPRFAPGDNAVQFTGSVTKLTIDGRWRYL